MTRQDELLCEVPDLRGKRGNARKCGPHSRAKEGLGNPARLHVDTRLPKLPAMQV